MRRRWDSMPLIMYIHRPCARTACLTGEPCIFMSCIFCSPNMRTGQIKALRELDQMFDLTLAEGVQVGQRKGIGEENAHLEGQFRFASALLPEVKHPRDSNASPETESYDSVVWAFCGHVSIENFGQLQA